MRKRDSSVTRVAPAFDYIFASNQYSRFVEFVNKNAEREGCRLRLPKSVVQSVWYDTKSAPADCVFPQEIRRRSSVDFLVHIVKNSHLVNWDRMSSLKKSSKAIPIREQIRNGRFEEAVRILDTDYRTGKNACADYVLEGATQPDVCIKTDKYYLVIEGKRTESGLTRHTDWVRCRDQMIRHIDAFVDNTDGSANGDPLPVYGLYIVECPDRYAEQFKDYAKAKFFAASMPHRSQEQVAMICDKCFLGYVTWEGLWRFFDKQIPYQKTVGEPYRPWEYPESKSSCSCR